MSTTTKRLSIAFTKHDYKQLMAISRREGDKPSQVVKRALDLYYFQHYTQPDDRSYTIGLVMPEVTK